MLKKSYGRVFLRGGLQIINLDQLRFWTEYLPQVSILGPLPYQLK